MERTYNPCDECEYAFHKNNQESGMCKICEYKQASKELKSHRDAEEQGLLLRLDSKDELIEVLANKLLNSEFGRCYMCTNPMKNITLDGVNNGCDGGCNTSEEFTVEDFLKRIVSEIEHKKRKQKLAEQMKGV